ncbi:hypothetical protein BDV12DRAFT_183346 [Aspergillus spectabilis]
MTKLGVLSPSSTCHTFDAAADAYARGEGFAALYLKRASDAVDTSCPIRAFVRGTAIHANGRTGGITHPSQQGQEAVIQQAYHNANLPLDQTTYFECHGTGTPVGDPIEVAAIGNVFSPYHSPEEPLLIGSITTNLVHTESGSAIAGIMKLYPRIDFQSAAVEVLQELTPWPVGKCRRASSDSFGYGGANEHCIIDHVNNVLPGYTKPGLVLARGVEAIDSTLDKFIKLKASIAGGGVGPCPHLALSTVMTNKAYATTPECVLLPFSAHSESSLDVNIAALAGVVHQHSLADLAYTLSARRTKFTQRSYRIIDKNYVEAGLCSAEKVFSCSSTASKIGYIFTGQGAQWPAMGSQLMQYDFGYGFQQLPTPCSWSIEDIVTGNCSPDQINVPEVSQTVCTAVEVELVDLLFSWKVIPHAVIGHSSGEIAAAYAAGQITAAEAIVTANFHGLAVSRNTGKGAMLAVGLGLEEVQPYIKGRERSVTVAAINPPGSVTLSGDTDGVEAVSQELGKQNVFNRLLWTGGNAYHSHHMLPLGEKYQARLSHQGLRYLSTLWESSVVPGADTSVMEINASYWRANLESPVRFSETIGPHPAVKGPTGQILANLDRSVPYIASLERKDDGRTCMLHLAGTLFGHNAPIDLAAVNSAAQIKGTCLSLSRLSKEIRSRRIPHHDLIGSKLPGATKLRPQWRNVLRIKDLSWLGDHRLLSDAVFPAVGDTAMVLEAATCVYKELAEPHPITGFSLQNLSIGAALRVPEDDQGIEIVLTAELAKTATAKLPGWITFSVSSVALNSDAWTELARARPRMSLQMDPRVNDTKAWYRKFAQMGLGYGPAFQGLSDIQADPAQNLATAQIDLETTKEIQVGESHYPLHPASLDALDEDGIIMTGAYPQLQRCFDSLAHPNPSINILEVGAGTGGATRTILDALTESHGIKRYQSYQFTDITSGFLNAAQDTLAENNDMQFSVLEIEQDPLKNGYQPVYEVVVASQCLHATSCIDQTLVNCRKLLQPGRKLVLVENVRTVIGMGVVLRTLSGYWSGVAGGRVDSPFLDLDGRNAALIRAGFSGAELVLDDYPQPYTTACTIVATAVERGLPATISTSQELCLLHWQEQPELFDQLAADLSSQHIACRVAHVDEVSLPPSSWVIVYLGNADILINMDARRLQQIQQLVRNSASMVWIISCGVIHGKNPNAGVALGLLRTIGTMNPTSHFQLLDLDPDCDLQDPNLSGAIIEQELLLQAKEIGESEDCDLVWQRGCFWVSRLVPDFGLHDQCQLISMPASRTPGILTSLYFKPYAEMDAPPREDWIQIKVAAVGLNWKDMAISAGRFDMNTLSSEFSGVVDKLGSAVTRLSPGDRVYGFGKCHFGNNVRVPAASAQLLQERDDLVQMASMPLVVLIQSATGGLGLCAIQLARSMGAEMYCTVGSSEKARYLTDQMGVPATRIFFCRDPADIPRLVEASGGRGVDVILSTATGEMLHESVKALEPLGRYMRSTTFTSFDLGVVVNANPDMGRVLMESLDIHYRAGHIGPIPALITSDISRLDQVLLRYSKGTHIRKRVFDPEARYIITGGLGGLGRSILTWMVSRGARYLLVLSWSGTCSAEAQLLMDDLCAKDAIINYVCCDVSVAEKVNRVIAQQAGGRPIREIVHAAVSYEDLSFDKLSIEKWQSGLAAKIPSIDFFVMTTSIDSMIAHATQSAYTAANTFQEHFARYRRRQGLPASTTSYGHITGLGHFSTNTTTINLMARNKVLGITEHEVRRLLEPAFLNNNSAGLDAEKEPYLGATEDPLSAATVITCTDPRRLSDQGRIRDSIKEDGESGRVRTEALVTNAITRTVAGILFVEASTVDANRTVAEYGVDSLIAAESRNYMLNLLDIPTSIRDLAEMIVGAALAKLG